MKDEFYSESTTIMPNILFLETSELLNRDELINDYYEILAMCKTKTDFIATLKMIYDEVTERTGKLIIERQIIDKVKQLDELRNSSEF